MKNNVSLVILCSQVIFGCETLNLISDQKIERTFSTTDFTISNKNQMIVKPTVNGIYCEFIFDTGAPFIISDTSIISNIDKEKTIYFGRLKLPDGKTIKNRSIPLNFNLGFAKSENKLFTVLDPYATKCGSVLQKTKGIIGSNYLYNLDEKGTFISLNFSDSIIENMDENTFTKVCKNYNQIKSDFIRGKLYIYITVAAKEIKLLFDTGNSGSIILGNDDYNFISKNCILNEGYMSASYSGLIKGKDQLIFDEPILISGNSYLGSITCSSEIDVNNFGLIMIKAFDWLIDYENKNVYLKKNDKAIDNTYQSFSYKCAYLNDKLIIAQRELPNIKFNIGDEIISVDSIKITAENACDYGRLLNNTLDWNTMNVEVISALHSDKN